ncbi:amidohydrolase [Salsuginibacillus kocurii]|uniref:amidohydrolase n=1 Tax=Salsuginibacillus kocurii TaxID=427078 RepID=UPI00036E91A9|nr:amidohydrolase [Salsuginibacillus kocurii]
MRATSIENKIYAWFHHLHVHPEPSWSEWETTNYIQHELEAAGIQVETFGDIPGLTATIGSGRPIVGLRADMDALMQEVDGVYQANHSCGHDGHMTMVTAAAYLLKELEPDLVGTVKLIYQPAEEKATGALALVEKGVVDELDYLFGLHMRPENELPYGKASVSISHGSAAFFEGEIKGRDIHGGRPHLGANAIEVGAEINQQLAAVHVDPQVPHSLKLTRFQAGGESPNIIPGNATFSVDLRSQDNAWMDYMQKELKRLIAYTATRNDIEIELKPAGMIAAAQISEEAEQKTRAAIERVMGPEAVAPRLVTSGGDDFHFYTIKRPHLKAAMIGLGANLAPGLHDANMTFERKALLTGADLLVETVLAACNQEGPDADLH